MIIIRARGLELSALVVSACLLAYYGFITFWDSHKLTKELPFSVSFEICFAMTLWTFGLTIFTEPGFLPSMKEIQEVYKDPSAIKRNQSSLDHLNLAYWKYYSPDSSVAPTENYVLFIHKNRPTAIAFQECDSCGHFKPTRSTNHCREPSCGRCVVGKDHHCLFLGTCIGTRNRPHFIAFLVSFAASLTISILISISVCLGYFRLHVYGKLKEETRDVSFVEICLLCMFCVFALIKVFVFPIFFTYKENLKIYIVLSLFGLFTILFVLIKGHAPVMTSLVGYAEICLAIFIAMNLVYQIGLLRKGSTLRQLVKQETENDRLDSPLLEESNGETHSQLDEDDAMSASQIVRFIATGFWLSTIPSMLLDIEVEKSTKEENAFEDSCENRGESEDLENPRDGASQLNISACVIFFVFLQFLDKEYVNGPSIFSFDGIYILVDPFS